MKTYRFDVVRTLLILLCCPPAFCGAQEDEDDLLPGLVTTLTDHESRSIQRLDSSPSFEWKRASPDERLDVRQIKLSSSGLLEVLGKGDYSFGVHAVGRGSVTIDDAVILEFDSRDVEWQFSTPVALSFGLHDIKVEYAALGDIASFNLFWQGKKFRWEPIQSQFLYHESHDESIEQFDAGRKLAHALKCAACHSPEAAGDVVSPSLAPDLSELAGNVDSDWLTAWLKDHGTVEGSNDSETSSSQIQARTMPYYSLNEKQAEVIATYLLHSEEQNDKAKREVDSSEYTKAEEASGREIFLTTGCIACHQYKTLGKATLFDGGDLTNIADKRPSHYFERWLESPEELNKNHRMPVFDFSKTERRQVAAFLSTLGKNDKQPEINLKDAKDVTADETKKLRQTVELGQRQFKMLGCARCHEETESTIPLSIENDDPKWKSSCLEKTARPAQPFYRLSDTEKLAIRKYFDSIKTSGMRDKRGSHGPEMLLAENNCLACHSRNGSPGLQQNLTDIATYDAEFAASMSVMTPPSLTSVGDKFTEKNLIAAITNPDNSYRDWLKVRMPKFKFNERQAESLAKHLINYDHIPKMPKEYERKLITDLDSKKMTYSAPSLVTSNGFSCVSCHQIGSQVPASAPANARGPDLSMIKDRVRHEWFDRWMHDPARIVPGMEMPSVQSPVRGYFDDDVDQQLAAVWKLVNKKGFEPPIPQPIRVLSRSGNQDDNQRALTLVDVVSDHQQNYVKPIVIGLPNRQNILFDFETGRLVRWWTGDMLNQQNRGKTWFWEPAGETVLTKLSLDSEFKLIHPDFEESPSPIGQFVCEPDTWSSQADGSVVLKHRLLFKSMKNGTDAVVNVTQTFLPVWETDTKETQSHTPYSHRGSFAFERSIGCANLPEKASIEIVSDFKDNEMFDANITQTVVLFSGNGHLPNRVTLHPQDDGSVWNVFRFSAEQAKSETDEETDKEAVEGGHQRKSDSESSSDSKNKSENLAVLPGFEAIRLPITRSMMPTAITWRPDGKMLVADLKGRVWLVDDSDGDGIDDRSTVISEELATPYGLAATNDYIDVATKFAVIRMTDEDNDGHYETNKVVASGWGHTDDYHDWVVGLPKSKGGGYYISIPCQQDDRSEAAAKYRGRFLELVPREATLTNPLLFDLKVVSSGHRFPMGIAVNDAEQIFVTDNQGNYNPFNELNHVRPNAFFGFVNRSEKGDAKINSQPVDAPAIDIPHPWTRSVNGITFLEIPNEPAKTKETFGPFAGHLVGAEYDSKRLVRMSIQKVGDTIQGAAYPFSLDPADAESSDAMIGPVEVAVSPRGDIVVGSMRDSGWGAGNNVGELIRIRSQLDKLPTGIAELRLVSDGFEIQFTRPIDAQLAADPENYVAVSYTRTSTPKYGGDDEQRRPESVRSVKVADDRMSVRVSLGELRENFVYEFRLKQLVKEGEFFPTEAFYTLRKKVR